MKEILREVDAAIKDIEDVVRETDRMVAPIRKTVLQRFPVIFAFLVSFGAATTFYGIERIIATAPWLNDRPWLIIVIGLSILATTGTLYKRLNK